MKSEQIINKLNEFLSTKEYLSKGDDSSFIFNANDHLEDKKLSCFELEEMFKLNAPRDYLCNTLIQYEETIQNLLFEDLIHEFSCNIDENFFNEFICEIAEHLQTHLTCHIDAKPLLQEELESHFIIATEDEADSEFTLNTLDDDILQDGALKWLIEQQGYSVNDFYNAFYGKVDINKTSNFIRSICRELCNITTYTNKLTVLSKIKVSDLLNWDDLIKNLNSFAEFQDYTVTIPKNTRIGLVDTYNGAGSAIEIELEKDLIVPLKYVYDVKPDNYYKYSVNHVYGPSDSFWGKHSIEVPQEVMEQINQI